MCRHTRTHTDTMTVALVQATSCDADGRLALCYHSKQLWMCHCFVAMPDKILDFKDTKDHFKEGEVLNCL